MADSGITSYRILLKQIADQLSKQNVKDIVFLFELPKATKINTGTELFQEMEDRDLLDEDNLDNFKDALKHVGQTKLLKKVTAFEEAKKPGKSEDKLSQSWPAATFSQQTPRPPVPGPLPGGPNHDVSRPLYDEQNFPYTQGGVPLGDSQGYQYTHMAQAYPHAQQQYQGVAYPMQGCRQPGPRMTAHTMPYQGGYGYPYPHDNVRYGNQGFPQQQLPGNQQMGHQFTGNPAANSINHAQLQYSMGPYSQQHPDQRLRKQSCPQASQGHPNGVPMHLKLAPVKSAPPGTATELADFIGRVSLGPEPEASLKKMPASEPTHNIPLNIPPGNNTGEDVAKATVTKHQTENGNVIDHTSSVSGHSSNENIGRADGRVANSHADSVYQTGRVRAESVESNNDNSIAVAAHPMSSRSDPILERLSAFIGKQLHDYRKVAGFPSQNGSYQVSIPEGEHYSTSEGAFVFVNFNSDYSIRLRNNDERLRCSALVRYDGKVAGEWTLDPNGAIVIERPAYEDKRFHFIRESRAPPGSGVRQGDPNNGMVVVEFTPERQQVFNDLTRGFGVVGDEPGFDYFGDDDDDAISDNDITRSCWPATLQSCEGGATILQGRSAQQFTLSEDFQLDERRKQVIVLKLLGK